MISALLSILKTKKPKVVDAYYYSDENPPIHPKYKYTDKLYIGCIFYILKYGTTWESFIGPIPGKQLNKRHNEYLGMDLYADFFNISLKKYLKHRNIKYLSVDSTIINNKNCVELTKHLPINKNRKGVKISTIVDDSGSPLTHTVVEATEHDITAALENLSELEISRIVQKALEQTDGHVYLLGDKGYDGSTLTQEVKKMDITPIIPAIKRKGTKRRRLTRRDKKKLRKRIKVEHFFGIIKRTAKINCIYEKKIASYNGLLSMLFGSILLNRIIK